MPRYLIKSHILIRSHWHTVAHLVWTLIVAWEAVVLKEIAKRNVVITKQLHCDDARCDAWLDRVLPPARKQDLGERKRAK